MLKASGEEIRVKYLVIIQARCGSSRLPEKVLMDLACKSVVERVVERVQKSKKIDNLLVATSMQKNNLPLIERVARNGVQVFVGSESDVLDRYYQAARLFNSEYVIRVTADCPLIDHMFIDQMIEQIDEKTDYVSADLSFPVGVGAEIIKTKVLNQAWQEARLASEREHVTLFVSNHPERFNIKTLNCEYKNASRVRLTLDHPEDYELISIIYNHFAKLGRADDFGTLDVLKFLEQNPKLKKINEHIDRQEGLDKSLAQDRFVRLEVDENAVN